jgi:hypothetical protein
LGGISDHEDTLGDEGAGSGCDVVTEDAMADGEKTGGYRTTDQTESDDAEKVHAAASGFG